MQHSNEKQVLREAFPYRIELHAHTKPVSACSEVLPARLAEIYHDLGFHAVVITNHFRHEDNKEAYIDRYVADYEMTAEAAVKYGMAVLLGAELTFTENANDYLVYGVTKEMLSDIYDFLPHGLAAFRKEYPMPDSVLIHAHPFRNGMERVDTALLDGIEVYNMHPGHNSRIGFAADYARAQGVTLITAGSDFHHLDQNHEGLGAIRTRALPRSSFELAAVLKSRDYVIELGRNHILLP